MKAAKVKSGRGTACAALYPAKKVSFDNQPAGHGRSLQERQHNMTTTEDQGPGTVESSNNRQGLRAVSF